MHTLQSPSPTTQPALTHLSDFFDSYGFNGALQYSSLLFDSALHHKAWRHPEPYSIIHFQRQLQQLVATAFTLAADHSLIGRFTVPLGEHGQPDMMLTHHYIGSYQPCTAWQYFPRHLTALQYSEPMRVMKAFARYQTLSDWQQLLNDLLEHSLSNRSIHAHLPGVNHMKVRELLLQVVEAGHLMLVRSCGLRV